MAELICLQKIVEEFYVLTSPNDHNQSFILMSLYFCNAGGVECILVIVTHPILPLMHCLEHSYNNYYFFHMFQHSLLNVALCLPLCLGGQQNKRTLRKQFLVFVMIKSVL